MDKLLFITCMLTITACSTIEEKIKILEYDMTTIKSTLNEHGQQIKDNAKNNERQDSDITGIRLELDGFNEQLRGIVSNIANIHNDLNSQSEYIDNAINFYSNLEKKISHIIMTNSEVEARFKKVGQILDKIKNDGIPIQTDVAELKIVVGKLAQYLRKIASQY